MRAELNCAAVCPSAGIGPEPNWLVVSITTLPCSEPASPSASSIIDQGTESITTSPKSAASGGVPTEARSPISAASASSVEGSRENESFTSCPALANRRAALPPIRPAPMIPIRIASLPSRSDSQRLDDQPRHRGARVLLLTRDQVAVANREGPKQASDDEVGAEPPSLVLDSKRHHLLSDRLVGEILLDVGEAGHRLALDQRRPVGALDVEQRAGPVAEERRRLFGLVEGEDRVGEVLAAPEGEHRRLAAADDDRF